MKLFEYLAKERFRAAGIPTPAGRVVQSPPEAAKVAAELGRPVAVKSQVLRGGRGKAGGIRFADTPEQAQAAAEALLGMGLGDFVVDRVLVEEKLAIDRELYLGIAVDGGARAPVVLASARGGVDIEEVPEKDLVRRAVDPTWGLPPYLARQVVRRLGLTGALARQAADVLVRLYAVFTSHDAELVEINPLVVSGDRLIAADARLNVDDDAGFRQPDLPTVDEGTDVERRVRAIGLAYVELDGDIAVMANGAGITMATLDILQHYGGRPANFLDAGGGAGAEPMARAVEVLVSTRPRAILINIFGGITRCDDVARAILEARRRVGIPVPLVVRLVGTNQAEGVRMLEAEGISAYSSLAEAAQRAVALARGEGGAP